MACAIYAFWCRPAAPLFVSWLSAITTSFGLVEIQFSSFICDSQEYTRIMCKSSNRHRFRNSPHDCWDNMWAYVLPNHSALETSNIFRQFLVININIWRKSKTITVCKDIGFNDIYKCDRFEVARGYSVKDSHFIAASYNIIGIVLYGPFLLCLKVGSPSGCFSKRRGNPFNFSEDAVKYPLEIPIAIWGF